VRKAVIWILLFSPLVLGTASGQAGAVPAAAESPEAFIVRMQGFLQSGDHPAYLRSFAEDIRQAEQSWLETFFGDFRMDSVFLRTAGVKEDGEGRARVFVQAFYQNTVSALLESWTLTLERRREAWTVVGKGVTGNRTTLYKVRLPAERAERAKRVEVSHEDIRFVFTDAAVFYDNIPGIETALVIVGKGRVRFAPSDPNEKHQLQLLYKKEAIEDEVDSLFLRCSTSYFGSRVVVETGDGLPAVTAAERDKAAAVFSRNYPRSFTIENSFDKTLLSFLPQGDEAVLEFRARKTGELTYVFYPFSDDEVNLYDRGREKVICLYSPRPAEEPPAKKLFISFEEKFDITSYELDLSYTPGPSLLSGKARIEIVPKVDLLDNLKFRFSPELEILRITDEENRELFYTQDKLRKILYVYFLAPPKEKRPTAIEVYYRGRMAPTPPTTDVISQSGLNEKLVFRKLYETYFFTHAGFWYPGPAEDDYFQARLTLITPPEYRVVATGELVSRGRWDEMDDVAGIEMSGNVVTTFQSRMPVKYMSFIVGRFDRTRTRPGPVPVEMYVSSEILDPQLGLPDRAADILDYFGRSFGPYPYEKLGIVLRLWPTYGGHSPASFVVLNQIPWRGDSGFAPPVDTPVDLSQYEDYFLAHEIAHQWWGQGVSFDSYKDQWLSEGLAQYAAASYLRNKHGERAYAAILRKFARWTEKKSRRGPIIMGSRLSYDDFAAYQSIVYNKAALALFMLQDMLGRETFEAGLRAFFERHKFGAARTGHFISAMEAASGRDLKSFFQGWFYSYELPEVQATWTINPVPEGARLDLRLTQVKGRYVFPLWVECVVSGRVERNQVLVDDVREDISLLLPGRPVKVRINPDKAVPGKFY
jgi:Peptidase family M1 domain